MKKWVLFGIQILLLILAILYFHKLNQKQYQKRVEQLLKNMSLEEKIGQVLLVRLPEDGISVINSHSVAGFILFRKDFEQLTEQQVQEKIQNLQNSSRIPLLIATDEEGGTVVRVSSNPLLHHESFSSPREQYSQGGISQVLATTKEKNELLLKLGVNLNLAPVADIATHVSDYMYNRSIGLSATETGTYIQKVVTLCNQQNIGCTLKHFPGYGNNQDTHTDIVKDSRSYEFLQKNDLVPFQMGIDAKATSILMSHNIITAIDAQNPASLSWMFIKY